MLKPALQDDAFLADVAVPASVPEQLDLWWLGQSGFLIRFAGQHLLLDPYLSDSLTTKYARTDKPHVRLTERVVAPERLDFIQAVTSSHNHTDHLDGETLGPLVRANAGLVLVCARANLALAGERSGLGGNRLIGLDPDEAARSARVGPFEIHAVPAAHEVVQVDEAGLYTHVGFVVRCGPWAVYHSGDTVRYGGMESWLQPHRLDLALLPINGRAPERRVAGNLWGREAAQLAHDVGVRLVVPCHYDLFAFNTAAPDAFVAECHRLGQPHRVLRTGERLTLARPVG